MKFEFDVGTEEKHSVEYHVSRWRGTTYIRVDGEIFRKYLTQLYRWIGIPFGAVLVVLYLISGFDPFFSSFLPMYLVIIFAPFITSFVIDRNRFPITFIVGEKEKHTVQIELISTKFFAGFREAEYHVYIDEELFQTFQV